MEWNWQKADEGRIKRAKTVKFRDISSSGESPRAIAIGSGADDYAVTLVSCTCADFALSAQKSAPQPCKHMLALAMKCGILNENGNTPAQQHDADIRSLRSQIATAYGFYHYFNDPIISDREYDTLKSNLAALQGANAIEGEL